MSLDGAMLSFARKELLKLIGSRVEKIYQPAREEIVISLRVLGGENKGSSKLFFSANAGSARVCLTNAEQENPPAPPMFCMLLRKHLSGGKLIDIRQDGLERILDLDFECINEIGDVVVNTLTAELMGRFSNIILRRGDKVIDSVKRVTDEVSSVRRILPNIIYETPPRKERLNFFDMSGEEIFAAIEGKKERTAKALSETFEGIAPIFARECAFYSAGDVDALCNELDESGKRRFIEFFERAKNAPEFTAVIDESGAKKDLSFVDIKQYDGLYTKKKYESANELLDDFYEKKSDGTRHKARELLKAVESRIERVSRKLELQKKELSDCAKRDEIRGKGDLINANIYRLEKGMTSAELEDFATGEKQVISLDGRLSPAQNAQKYYTEYRKLCTAEKKLTELIKEGKNELLYLESVLDCAARAKGDAELSEIRRELVDAGLIKGEKTKSKPKRTEPLKYVSSDGFLILVGKNNRQNDELTLRSAKAQDIWLHVQNIAGSHVIVKTNGEELPERTLFEAARLAALHSKGKSSSGVPVDYTAVKFVKKPAGARPGMVIFTNNKTLFVTPDEREAARLADNNA